MQIENGWRNPKEQRPGAVQRGHIREIETVVDNPDAELVMPCTAGKMAIIVYGKRVRHETDRLHGQELPGA